MSNLAIITEDDLIESVWRGAWTQNENLNLSKIQGTFIERVSKANLKEELKKCTTNLERVKVVKPYFWWGTGVDHELVQLKQYSKSSNFSKKFRERANCEYKKRSLSPALRGYNLAILFGPIKHPETALAYGNRSAVLLELKHPAEAILDIEQALCNSEFPENLHQKLIERRSKCEALILKNGSCNQGPEKSKIFCVESPSNNIRCAEEFVKIDYSPNCGRKLIVTQAVPSGSVLLVEKPYATVLVDGLKWDVEHCYFCHKRIIAGIPCSNGVFATFCSQTCQDAANQSFHQFEHSLLPYLHAYRISEWERMALRLITTAGPEVLYKYFKSGTILQDRDRDTPENTVYESGYLQICGLISHKDPNNAVLNIFKSLVLVQLLKEFSSFFSSFELDPNEEAEFTDFVASLILHHLESIPFNAISFSELQSPCTSVSYATGVFPTLSLVNHSCCPNAIHVKRSEFCETALISLKPLKPGEEITISYGPTFTLKNTVLRRLELTEKYKFVCQCAACNEDWKPVMSNPERILNFSCDRCKRGQKCANCLEKALALHEQISKYEAILHEVHALLGNGSNETTVIQMLKPCLDFFGNFPASYELTQVAQELFKKAMVAFAARC